MGNEKVNYIWERKLYTVSGLLLLFAAVDFIGAYLFTYLVIVLSGQMAVTNWTLLILNIFLLPLYEFAVAKQNLEWNGEAELIGEDEYFHQLKQYQLHPLRDFLP